MISRFQEFRGEIALAIAVSSSARQCKEFSGEGSFELAVTSIVRKRRGDEETFEVVDDTMAERAIELLSRGLVTLAKKNLRPDARVRLVRHVRQVNPTASCRFPHASHVSYIVQCVSNHAMRQVHQVPEKYSEPICSLQSAIGMTAFG